MFCSPSIFVAKINYTGVYSNHGSEKVPPYEKTNHFHSVNKKKEKIKQKT